MNSSEQKFVIYNKNSNPYGIAYAEWITLWWKWLISIPDRRSPALDENGKFCGLSQSSPYVWFLAGTFGGSAVRECTIPYGRALLLPIINCWFSFADEPRVTTEEELEELCKVEMDKIGDLYASLDGNPIDVRSYRIHSRCFTVNMPHGNCLGGIVGETKMASDGYWLLIHPLCRGNHSLRSYGSCQAGRIKIGCTFQLVIK